MKNKKSILKNKNGQGLMEYIIISCLVGVFCLSALNKYGSSMNKYLRKMNTEVDSNLKKLYER